MDYLGCTIKTFKAGIHCYAHIGGVLSAELRATTENAAKNKAIAYINTELSAPKIQSQSADTIVADWFEAFRTRDNEAKTPHYLKLSNPNALIFKTAV